ncbi:MAG: hypothetical protein ACXWMJ_04680 [Syntrophales bacterium]
MSRCQEEIPLMLVDSVKFFRCQFEDKTAGHAEAALGSVADKTAADGCCS